MSDHYLIEGKVRVAERRRLIRGVAVGRMHIKVRELRKKEKVLRVSGEDKIWVGKSRGDGKAGSGGRVGVLKRRALEGGAEVCGYCKIGIGMRKGSEWWNDSMKKVVEEKKKN